MTVDCLSMYNNEPDCTHSHTLRLEIFAPVCFAAENSKAILHTLAVAEKSVANLQSF